MSGSQSWKNLGPEGEKTVDLRRASSQPLYTPQTTADESNLACTNAPSKSTMEDMRRRIVQLNKELEQERTHSKNLKRDKALEVRQVRDEEQKKASSMQADLRSKLHKEKMNELTSLREQLHKEKEKDIIQIIRQKDEAFRTAQQAWAKEKEEMKSRLRSELRSESREDTKREFEKERGRLEQEIADLHRQKRELEDTLKLVQGADKRKIDDIRRIHHEHEAELEKFKRNSWQESRQQMAEIRQLLNIIEQLEKRLGLEAGHSMRLRLEKDSLYDMLKKSTTYDAWDRMMSSTHKDEQGRTTPPGTPDSKHGSQELRILQRKNVELSSLVRKLDEKNQQLATRNAELLAELEKLEKDNRDKNRKLERKNADLTQTNKRLESRNKMLLDEINALKKSSTTRKDNSVRPRGRTAKEQDELGNLRAQLREQTRNIADLKQSLMDKDRRIEVLRSRKKKNKRQSPTPTSLSADFLSVDDDDALSVHSDFSEASEMSSSEDVDSKRIKKLAKELLALERAYALLQAHVGSAVDAERDEMEKQQLQSDLIESQTRIHELERMMDESGQGSSSEQMSQIQADNKALYQQLVSAEKERDKAQAELAKYSEDVRELKDQRDLLEFELEEMSQLSTAGSEDWDSRRSRSVCSFDLSPTPRKDNDNATLSLEEIKASLEELETEKENVLSPLQQSALKQARQMLESMAEKINHMEITESALRDKVRDLDLGYNSESLKSELSPRSLSVVTCDQETLTDLQWIELEDIESFYREQQFEALGHPRRGDLDIATEDSSSMTDLVWEDVVSMESIYRKYLNGSPEGIGANGSQFDLEREDKECMTDLAWQELAELEESYRNYLEDLSQVDMTDGKRKGKGERETVDNETITELDLEELAELESSYQKCLEQKVSMQSRDDTETMTDIIWEELLERANNEIYLTLRNEMNEQLKERGEDTCEIGIMTDLVLSELVEMEDKYLEFIENESKVPVQKEELTEALPEVVLDTFPEDITNTRDEYAMTELKWDDIVSLQDKCYGYERHIEELEKEGAHFEVKKDEKGSCTDLSWDDITDLQDKCSGYELIIQELENKLVQFQVQKSDKGSSTEMSLQDLAVARFSVELKEAETMTDFPEDVMDNEGLPHIVLETFPGEIQTKDECDMTEGVWDEVVDLKNTYQDYRQNLEEMKNKLAQFEVEKDDKESITDIAMQDLADLESMYRERLREVDSDSNSLLSHAEKESRECMTELTFIEIAELEDFYIENAARQMEASPVVEKWEQESMTDITLDDMQYLEQVEDLYRQKGDSAGEKDEKCTETNLTIHDVDYLQEMSSHAELLQAVEKLDIGTITELTIPDLVLLEDTQERHQSCLVQELNALDKEDRGVSTELTADDLKYWEDVETAHEECLLEREQNEARAGIGSEERQDAEMMTEFTMIDLQYLEEVDTAHEDCLLDREEEGKTDVERQSVVIMTDLTVSDLQYLEDVESAHEECLADKQEEFEAKGVEKQSAEIMTDLSVSDLQYLEEIEAVHEECLADKQEESAAKDSAMEKESVEVMTDLTISDLQYLEDVEAAHEECLVDKQEESEAQEIAMERKSVELMTDLTIADLQYLEEIEAVHEECLVDQQEELQAKEITVKESVKIMTDLAVSDLRDLEDIKEQFEARNVVKQNAEIMTDLSVSDLQYLEEIEAVHEECLVDKQEESEAKDIPVERESVEIMTDLTISDLQYLEDVEAAHEECLVDKQEESEAQEIAMEKESVEIMTISDLQYLEEIEAVHEECLVDQQEELQTKEITVKESVEIMTDLAVSDLRDLEDIKEQFEARNVVKQNAEIMTDLSVSDLQYLEEIEAVHEECLVDKQEESEAKDIPVERESVEIMTDLTISDLQYLEDVEAAHEECLVDKQEESEAQEIAMEKESVEIMTDLTISDLQYLEEIEAVHEECLVDQQEELQTKEITVKESVEIMTDLAVSDLRDLEDIKEQFEARNVVKQNAEIMTDLSVSDLQYLEEIEAVHEECLVDKQEESEAKDIPVERESVEIMTDLTISDLQYLEDVEAAHEECRVDKQEESEAKEIAMEKESVEIMTDLTISDLQYLEGVEAAHEECLVDKQEDLEAKSVEKQNVEIMTDLTVSDLQYLEDVETAHEECLLDKLERENARMVDSEKHTVGTMTDMTNHDLRGLESVAEKEKSKTPKFWRRKSRSSSISDHVQNKNTMTEMTGNILDYYEDMEVLYKETVVDFEEFKRMHSADKEEKDIMTDLTIADLRHLEEESLRLVNDQDEKEMEDKEMMTELVQDDVEYLVEVESLYKEMELQQEPKGTAPKTDAETVTELTLSYIENVEEELERLKLERSPETDSSWVVIEPDKEDKDVMTDLNEYHLQYLEEVETLYKERVRKLAESAIAEVMTDLTTADLAYFEEAENLLKKISGEGGDIFAMLAPKDDKEMITDLTSSDIDYLQALGDVYGDGSREATAVGEVEKDDKGTETDLTIAHIRDLEDQADTGTELKTARPFQEFVNEDFKAETLVSLQSELDYLPIFDEPEFILDEEDKEGAEVLKTTETGVMTELTIADIRDLEDQVDNAVEVKTAPSVNEDFQFETLDGLQSELEFLPILDEPEFILDEQTESEGIQRQDAEVMTEVTLSDLEHLEAVEKQHNDDTLESNLKDIQRQDTSSMTEVSLSDLEHLEAVEKQRNDDTLEDIQSQDTSSMTEMTLPDLEYLEAVEQHRKDEEFPERSETGIQCDLGDFTSLMQELSKEAEENGENVPSWFVSALRMRKPDGGFNPVHLVVRQSDSVDALPTDEHSDVEYPFENFLEETPDANPPSDSMFPSERSTRSLDDMPIDETDPDSWIAKEGDASSNDIGIQCDIVDLLAMLAEYQKNTNEDDLPWFVSAMNMSRDDTGFDPVQVQLRNRSDSSPVQDGMADKQSNSFVVELSRPPPPPRASTFTFGSPSSGHVECPDADSSDPLFASQDGSDSVFNRTDESLIPPDNAEERDVLTDMPQDSSAVNRFDRFLKERKDSELLNLQALKEDLDDSANGGTVDVKSLKDLEEENELLRRQLQTLENSANTEELENEIAALKGQVESVKDLEEENQLLKEEINILRESANTEELENEIAALKGQVESVKDLEEENQLLKEEINILRESAVVEDIEEENALLKDKIKMLEEMVVADEDVKKIEKENEELREKVKDLEESANTEDLQRENNLLKQQVEKLAPEQERVKQLEEENEMLQGKIQALGESTNVEDLVAENSLLKEQIEIMVEPERVKELEDENEMLKEKVQMLEESSNVEDLVTENSLLKEQIEIMVEPEKVKQLEDENEMLKEKVQLLEESSNVEDLVNENALLKEQIEIMEEAGKEKELEYENKVLKEKVQMLEESAAAERLGNEQLMEKMQDLEDSTARVVERLEEENSILKENIQILEDSTTNMKDLEDENALLREKIKSLGSSRNVQELEEENASLKEKIRCLEESSAVDLPNEEFGLLQLKIDQLKEAEKKIGALNEANMALKERIDLLQMEKKNVRENWSEMDPSEQLGKVRLLLVQELGLTTSEVESVLGSCDLESLVSSGMATPRADLNNLGEYFEQADRGVQAEFDEVPPSIQRRPGISGGINILKLLEVTRDGSIPERIAKELEKLKDENRELYEELMELRRKIKAREVAQRSNEATQTEHAYLTPGNSCDVIEEAITPQVRATVATEIRYLGDRSLEFEPPSQAPLIQFESLDLDGTDGLIDYPEDDSVMPSYNDSARDSDGLISEPELVSARRNLDSVMDDIDRRIQDLRHLDDDDDDVDRPRTDTSDLVVFDSDDDGDLPPLPESSPPPLPSEPPPDFPEASPPVLDHGIEVLLRSESSPPRNAATLRASSRARSHSENKPTSEASQPSSRVESPVMVEEPTLVLDSEPSQLGGIYPEPSHPSPSFKRPSGLGSNRIPPQVLPKPKRTLLQKRQPGELHKPLVSYESSDMAPPLTSQWSRDEEDGVIPPRGIVLNRASSINRGEIDALNEKIGFLERQLKNKENVIRSMKTEATELETKSLLERRDREMKILDEDVAFLKKENQKKERELLTKIGEMNKKNYEIEQWKAEANNSERQRQRMEAAYMNLQNQMKNLQGAELKLAELQTKYSGVEKQNFELSEKVKNLEKTETEFKKLEHNIQLLQAQVQEMDIVEQDRNNLVEKMKIIENQRDDLLRKGRVVESERNDFLRNNKLMEMQRDDLESRCAMLQKTNATLNSRVAELERDIREAQTKMHDSQHERNFLQVQLDKLEADKNEMQKRFAITTQERNSLENQVAELKELSRDHVKLEDGFHALRIKLAESTREKDDAEMQIPTLKAKIALLKRACKEKDELVDKLSEEIRDLRHAIATSALDDLSKIRSYGYSPENFVKLSAQREQERQIAKRDPEDLVEERLQTKLDKHSQRRSPRPFAPSPPGTKKAKRFVALFDYDPHKSPACEHPELELKLKEGDLLTVYGDMDINGYYEADVNGLRGLVPSLYVDEVEGDNDSELGLEEYLTKPRRDPVKDVPSYKGHELPLQRDTMSSGHITPSSGASSVGSEPRQCMVALHDYNPFHSGTSGRPAREQLSFKKGDVMTVYGNMDANGFYRVDLSGQSGFVPGHLVEEVSSSSFLHPASSRAPEQILGMLDNIQAQGQPKASSADIFTPPVTTTNGYPTHAQGDVTPPRHVRLPGSPLSNVGFTRFKPSPEVAKLGPSLRTAVVPVNSPQSSQRPVPSAGPQKPVSTSLKPSPSKQIVPVSSNKSRSSKKARPSPPGFFRVLRPVNHDAMLLGWTLPEMDEFGSSNGLSVKGYKIYANGDVKLDVRSPYMAKALVEDLELRFPIKFSIKTVAENGSSSEVVSAKFNDTIKGSILDSCGEFFEDSGDEQKHYRTFVALYDYDPFKSSPNPNPASELSFKEGDILRVIDTSRQDGFYEGKLKNKSGLIPSNFVEEVAVATPRRLAAAKKQQAALPSPTRPFSRESNSSGGVGSPSLATKDPMPLRRKMMVALYDYNPEAQSPQDNPDSELPFKKGQILTVLGEMRADGFYHADMNGQLGLVPGSFLDEYKANGDTDSGLESGRRVSFEKGRSQRHLGELNRV